MIISPDGDVRQTGERRRQSAEAGNKGREKQQEAKYVKESRESVNEQLRPATDTVVSDTSAPVLETAVIGILRDSYTPPV